MGCSQWKKIDPKTSPLAPHMCDLSRTSQNLIQMNWKTWLLRSDSPNDVCGVKLSPIVDHWTSGSPCMPVCYTPPNMFINGSHVQPKVMMYSLQLSSKRRNRGFLRQEPASSPAWWRKTTPVYFKKKSTKGHRETKYAGSQIQIHGTWGKTPNISSIKVKQLKSLC